MAILKDIPFLLAGFAFFLAYKSATDPEFVATVTSVGTHALLVIAQFLNLDPFIPQSQVDVASKHRLPLVNASHPIHTQSSVFNEEELTSLRNTISTLLSQAKIPCERTAAEGTTSMTTLEQVRNVMLM